MKVQGDGDQKVAFVIFDLVYEGAELCQSARPLLPNVALPREPTHKVARSSASSRRPLLLSIVAHVTMVDTLRRRVHPIQIRRSP